MAISNLGSYFFFSGACPPHPTSRGRMNIRTQTNWELSTTNWVLKCEILDQKESFHLWNLAASLSLYECFPEGKDRLRNTTFLTVTTSQDLMFDHPFGGGGHSLLLIARLDIDSIKLLFWAMKDFDIWGGAFLYPHNLTFFSKNGCPVAPQVAHFLGGLSENEQNYSSACYIM